MGRGNEEAEELLRDKCSQKVRSAVRRESVADVVFVCDAVGCWVLGVGCLVLYCLFLFYFLVCSADWALGTGTL